MRSGSVAEVVVPGARKLDSTRSREETSVRACDVEGTERRRRQAQAWRSLGFI